MNKQRKSTLLNKIENIENEIKDHQSMINESQNELDSLEEKYLEEYYDEQEKLIREDLKSKDPVFTQEDLDEVREDDDIEFTLEQLIPAEKTEKLRKLNAKIAEHKNRISFLEIEKNRHSKEIDLINGFNNQIPFIVGLTALLAAIAYPISEGFIGDGHIFVLAGVFGLIAFFIHHR